MMKIIKRFLPQYGKLLHVQKIKINVENIRFGNESAISRIFSTFILIFWTPGRFGLISQIVINKSGEKEIFGNLRIICANITNECWIFRIGCLSSSYIYCRIRY
ncbi:unnamed protein product [Heterotrigona itama]|uniref:Uncharacterized protein n=1 Tax=Heterotrigona itama TaxID=395501 RepID=A0A6V7H2K4_9HYME|nr:unnamed protein product [Heterotrigona itama]